MERWEYEEKRREFINDFYYEVLKFCGCGNPEDILFVIKNVLNATDRKWQKIESDDYNLKHSQYYNESIIDMEDSLNLRHDDDSSECFSVNTGVKDIILNLLDKAEVLDHGGSIGGVWITPYGEKLLNYLNELSDEELEYILD